jgi:iron complex transport system ATP-binding protein
MVLRDLNNAARYSHHIVALADGRVYDVGPPDEVVTPDLLREVFGVEADVVPDPRTGAPLCIPQGLHHRASKLEAER